MKKVAAILVILLILLGIAWLFYKNYFDKKDDTLLTLYGNVDIRQVNLSFRVPGRIAKLHFDEGDEVKKGSLVAVLDKQPYLDEEAAARAALEGAKANLLRLRTGNRPQEIRAARATVAERQAEYENAALLYERRMAAGATGAVSLQSINDALAAMKEASARLESAKEQLQLQEEGFRKEDIQQGEAQVAEAEARLQLAITNLRDTEVIAPNDGIILTRVHEEGAVVAVGSPVFTLSLVSPMFVRAYVSEPDLGKIYQGMKVLIYTDFQPDKPYHGQIGYISPVAEFTPKNVETETLRTALVYRIRVVVKDPDARLKQGMPVTVKINLAKDND